MVLYCGIARFALLLHATCFQIKTCTRTRARKLHDVNSLTTLTYLLRKCAATRIAPPADKTATHVALRDHTHKAAAASLTLIA